MIDVTRKPPDQAKQLNDAFKCYKNLLVRGGEAVLDLSDEQAAWLRENHISRQTRPIRFERVDAGWLLNMDRVKPGKRKTELRLAVEALAPGATLVSSEPETVVRATAANVARATGIAFKVSGSSGQMTVARADEAGGFNLPTEAQAPSKYGFEDLAVGQTATMPAGTLIDQVRSVAQYQRRRYGRVFSVCRTPAGITITRKDDVCK